MKRKILIALAIFLCVSFNSDAQKFALKTNLLYDATATVNVGAEFGLAPRWTFDLSGNVNAWTLNDHKLKHLLIQPEARYWFCDRFQGHFLGAHALGGIYNIGYIKNDFQFLGKDYSPLTDNRFQGWFAGAGVAYGYALPLSKHWNLEFELGVGYIYTVYDKYECFGCGKLVDQDVPVHYVGPTKAAINLVYVF
jgi:hypothetical protein